MAGDGGVGAGSGLRLRRLRAHPRLTSSHQAARPDAVSRRVLLPPRHLRQVRAQSVRHVRAADRGMLSGEERLSEVVRRPSPFPDVS